MAENKQHSFFYKFLMSPDFKVWRHLTLIFALFIISVNYALPEDNIDRIFTPMFGVYVLALLCSYTGTIYLNIYYLIPKFLIRKKYFAYVVYLLLLIVFLLIIQFVIEYVFPSHIGIIPYPIYILDNNLVLTVNILANLSMNLLAFIGASVTVLIKYWINSIQNADKLEREHLQTEVEQLKEQVSPDFLFSTMQAIGKMETLNPDEASFQLMKLCRLLRYQLYDANRETTFLISEIRYLTNYLELQQLNYAHLKFDIQLYGDIQRTVVPPMIFIAFVQKAVHNNKDECVINIHFEAEEDKLYFKCFTSEKYIENIFEQKKQQRLDILFGEKYSLRINEEVGIYNVELDFYL